MKFRVLSDRERNSLESRKYVSRIAGPVAILVVGLIEAAGAEARASR